MNTAAVIAALEWAAGGGPSEADELDEDLLLAAAHAHRLDVRLHLRLEAAQPSWASPGLRRFAKALHDDAIESHRRSLRTAALLARIAADGSPLRLIKGISYFALTGDPGSRGWQFDIDLLPHDPEATLARLLDAGFVPFDKPSPHPHGRTVAHELAKLVRADAEVDVQRHFPVWGLPTDGAETYRVDENPGVWRCASAVAGEHVRGFPQHLLELDGDDGERVIVATPQAAAAAMICCAHVYANAVAEFTQPLATVRLGELANLDRLLSAPNFPWQSFDTLIDAHRAGDAVGFALTLLERFLGSATASRWLERQGRPVALARDLWWARGSAGLLVDCEPFEPLEELLLRSVPARAIVESVGANRLPATSGARLHAALSDHADSAVARVLVARDASLAALGFRFAIDRDRNGARVEVRLPAELAAGQIDVNLNARSAVTELVVHETGEAFAYDRLTERRIESIAVERLLDDGELAIVARLPTERVADGAPSEPWHLLLGVRAWEPDGTAPLGTTLVPLVIDT